MSIFANHAHVFPKEARPEGTLDQLKQLMTSCGIERSIAFAPFWDQMPSAGTNPNDWLASELEKHDEILGFGTIDTARSDASEQAHHIHGLGFRGIKLHPAHQKFNILQENLQDFYAAAEDLGMMLCFHSGVHWHRIKDYHPLLFDELAFHFPKLQFSMEHIGGHSFFLDSLAVMTNNKRASDSAPSSVYGGVTSILNKAKNELWYLGPEKIEFLVKLVGSEQLIFGLDFPYNGIDETLESLEVINSLNVTPQDKANILGQNLERIISQ